MAEFKRIIDIKIDKEIERMQNINEEEIIDPEEQIRLEVLQWVKRNS